MKNYTITVNGNIYDVTVEENTSGNKSTEPAKQNMFAQKESVQTDQKSEISFMHQAQEMPKDKIVKEQAIPIAVDQENIVADAAGKVIAIEKQQGETVQVGDILFILEIMKMETPVTAQKAGILTSIQANVGDLVKTGDVLATLKA